MKINGKVKLAIAALVLAGCAFGGYHYYEGQQAAKQTAAVETTKACGLRLESVPATGATAVSVAASPGSMAAPGPTISSAKTGSGTSDSGMTVPEIGAVMGVVIALLPALSR